MPGKIWRARPPSSSRASQEGSGFAGTKADTQRGCVTSPGRAKPARSRAAIRTHTEPVLPPTSRCCPRANRPACLALRPSPPAGPRAPGRARSRALPASRPRDWHTVGSRGWARTGGRLQGQVEGSGSGLRGGRDPCQLGLVPEPGCVCIRTVAVIGGRQFRARPQLLSSLAQRPKGPGLGKQGRRSIFSLLNNRVAGAGGGGFSGNTSLNTAGICRPWLQRAS